MLEEGKGWLAGVRATRQEKPMASRKGTEMTIEQRYQTVEALNKMGPTLNGKPAIVAGIRSDYARVAALDSSTGWVEFAWGTANHFVKKGKADFKS
jgi:hypothetical protein